ncbi:MAG TPA: beta-galactosidase [Pyrinomonadaceae bacterium]|nr:beta-galactosidase [Pyrinomonadaceae bacterium]
MNRRELLKLGLGSLAILPFAKNNLANDFAPLKLDASVPSPEILTNYLKMGSSRNPKGEILTADSRSIWLKNRRWLPVMGEFHFSRYPENEWREELLKMKMGGINIVATYIFWIHHEEIESEFDWSGQRNLRKFIELTNEIGLYSIVRLGPWCHGEVRNGGLPDWILQKPYKIRTDSPEYLEKVKILYGEIANQIKGLYWKDGGNIIGAQFENEFKGRAEHLLNLKKIALEHGIDVPIYTRTAWHTMASPLPLGEIMPLFGVYAEGFWDREITPMPGKYGDGFLFKTARIDASIATDQLGTGARKDTEDVNKYPYFCCEIGGGMITSYHRRILSFPKDIESTALIKIGSGNNLQGFYMYHGGTNPQGKLTTLNESQATNYWNDMPVKSYEFQAPLGEFGQINPHYHSLRLQHLFFQDFGENLANMTTYLPEKSPTNSKDTENLRWSVRTDGESGFVFVNNYQRLQKMPAKKDVQFQIKLKEKTLTVPNTTFTVPEEAIFFMPFNLRFADAKLIYATAQPICKVEENGEIYLFFKEIAGIPPEFQFDVNTKFIGKKDDVNRYKTLSGKIIHIMPVNPEGSMTVWKTKFQGRERVFRADGGLVIDGEKIRRTATDSGDLSFSVFPPIKLKNLRSKKLGIFQSFDVKPNNSKLKLEISTIESDLKVRKIKMGSKGVAEAPSDADFDKAAIWQIRIPKEYKDRNQILRIEYEGDAARLFSGNKLLTDNFYNGKAFEIGIKRFAPEIFEKDLILMILPLLKDAPIYLADEAKPNFKGKNYVCGIKSVSLVEISTVEFK